ncbi:GNAT superfamily N-acetyltransferase [Rhizomicrobium palustre]|uniref:GNAT superfamily N-acetyltransferase n=1 Tax=Rhizomicrobium palustre TaxID=189966 RepID=A0A846N236_9PROT|nr:GNAT family N-acetyltransferase [Rhizomicrobium palustre]NIK90044.1 GNAT superfamily N-acetyltransferase [Rhizomicrobium palustre]
MVELVPLTGPAIAAHIGDLARLRITVFRDWPYLYEGDEAYERDYLSVFANTQDALVVLAIDNGAVVGASTGMPLLAEQDYVRAPFQKAGIDEAPIFYFSESVLLFSYRGQGIGVRFFEAREDFARQKHEWAYFCGVVRADNHPARPSDFVPLDAFWKKRGYAPVSGLTASFSWKDIGDSDETTKPMAFWRKRL